MKTKTYYGLFDREGDLCCEWPGVSRPLVFGTRWEAKDEQMVWRDHQGVSLKIRKVQIVELKP